MVRATRVIDIDLEFNEPTTKVVDDMTERDSVGEPSADEASTSEAMAPIVKSTSSFLWWLCGYNIFSCERSLGHFTLQTRFTNR
ncbi:hypothetical protein ACOSQ3_013413 [Xanthoceras sorbifolium]